MINATPKEKAIATSGVFLGLIVLGLLPPEEGSDPSYIGWGIYLMLVLVMFALSVHSVLAYADYKRMEMMWESLSEPEYSEYESLLHEPYGHECTDACVVDMPEAEQPELPYDWAVDDYWRSVLEQEQGEQDINEEKWNNTFIVIHEDNEQ
jgi:hypothetical protein